MDIGLDVSVAFFVVATIGAVASLLLLDRYRDVGGVGGAETDNGGALSFRPQDLGGVSRRILILASVAGLFVELLLIRWVSAEIRIFAYFKNFVLIACFLGFGLGFHLARRSIDWLLVMVPPVLLCALVEVPWPGLRELVSLLPNWLGAFAEVHVWGVPAVDSNGLAIAGLLAAVVVSVPLFALVSLVFVPIGQLIGWQIEHAERGIVAYSANILGSLAGILLFTGLAFADTPPAVWFAVAGALLTATVWRLPRLRFATIGAVALCVGLLAWPERADVTVRWSPYQKLTLSPARGDDGELIGYALETNGSWYQWIIDLSPDFVAAHPGLMRGVPLDRNAYNLPYRFVPSPGRVLVLGAGMGNDVAAALRSGAARVTAVEIDPLIVEWGSELHFEQPYQDPRVDLVVDDARSYLQRAAEQFDLVVFSLLDSHTTASHFSNIRIDNYVYTVEALRAARRLLTPDGVLIVKFQVDQPWIAARLRGLLEAAFQELPVQLQAEETYSTSGRFFISGDGARIRSALADPALAALVQPASDDPAVTLTTDDWPYFYQHEPGLPAAVLVISFALALVCWLALGRTGLRGRGPRWHFFFLGAGFLLVEAQTVSRMALLFGTTWLVNAVVISAILLLIVAANLTVEHGPAIVPAVAYTGLGATLLIAFLVPVDWLLLDHALVRAAVAGAVLCAPIFFASIVFIGSFAAVGFRGHALGANLFGALVGGMLESLSMWSGLRSLLLVAAALYAASWWTRRRDVG
jgi:SAM-dependent methyltransferase